MRDFLDKLASVAWRNVERGYYRREKALECFERRSLKESVMSVKGSKIAIIGEIKFCFSIDRHFKRCRRC